MGNNLKIAILIGLVAAILIMPERLHRTNNIKDMVLWFIAYFILFTIIGFMALLFIGMI